MRKLIIYVFLILTSIIYSQNPQKNCDALRNGTFDSFENGKKFGTIYRDENFQIEKYIGKKELNIIKFSSNKCIFLFKKENILSDIDTITWNVKYSKSKLKGFDFIVSPKFLKINYSVKGRLVKVSNFIRDKEVIELIAKLNNDTN